MMMKTRKDPGGNPSKRSDRVKRRVEISSANGVGAGLVNIRGKIQAVVFGRVRTIKLHS